MPSSERLCFGPFEFDPATGILCRDRHPIKLGNFPARLLALLLKDPETLVSYGQIRAALWDAETHVKFDQCIRHYAARVRLALGDDACKPVYIVTIQKQGYRFIAPVRKHMVELPGTSMENDKPIRESRTPSDPQPTDIPPLTSVYAPKEGAPGSAQILPTSYTPLSRHLLKGMAAPVFGVLAWAVLASAYAVAIGAFLVGAGIVVMIYQRSEDNRRTRAGVAIYLLAAMCYISNASTLGEVQTSVVNLSTLPPALSFQFVLGLRFLPLYVLVLGAWVLFGDRRDGDRRSPPQDFQKTYAVLGVVFLSATILSLAIGAVNDHALSDGARARGILGVGYATAFLINAVVWAAGRRSFRTGVAFFSQPLLRFCAMAFVPLALVAYVVDQEQNRINRYDLNIRRPEAYRVANPRAIEELDSASSKDLRSEIGPDLRTLLHDAAFRDALENASFYRQPWDEPFQLFDRAVIFGYRPTISSRRSMPFVVIRFPLELAESLQFQPIGADQ